MFWLFAEGQVNRIIGFLLNFWFAILYYLFHMEFLHEQISIADSLLSTWIEMRL